MQIATGIPNAVPGARGTDLVAWARRAETAGFSSLGTIGRTVFDSHEELIALAAAAGATERIRLATTVLIAPARETVLLAKQAATLDAVSGGRFSLGVGPGWRDDDFRATGTEFARRGKRLDQQIEVMRRVWAGEPPADGLTGVGPAPVRAGGPELIVGGMAPAALARAGRLGDAFLAPPIAPQAVRQMYDVVCDASKAAGRERPPRLLGAGYFALDDHRGLDYMAAYYAAGGGDFVQQMQSALLTTPERIRETLAGLEEVGVEEVFLWPTVADVEQVERLAEVVL